MKINKIFEKTEKAMDIASEYGIAYAGKRTEFQMKLRKNPQYVPSFEEFLKLTELTDKAINNHKKRYEARGIEAPSFVVFISTDSAANGMKDRTAESIKKQIYMPEKVFIGKTESISARLSEYYSSKGIDNSWVLIIKAGDVLEADFFYRIYRGIMNNPQHEIWYTDNDIRHKADEAYEDIETAFKPDFSLDYLCAWNYIGDALVVKAAALGKNFEKASYDGYRLLLDSQLSKASIGHIPARLYQKHQYDALEDSNQLDTSKLIRKIYEKKYADGLSYVSVIDGPNDTNRVLLHWKEKATVSVIIPTKDHIEDLAVVLKSLSMQTIRKQLEILIVENNSTDQMTELYYQYLETGVADDKLPETVVDDVSRDYLADNIKILHYPATGFNFSAINNYAEKNASGEYLLLLNNDIELINSNALEMMLMTAMRPDVGIVGAKLYYEDETVQHGGVVVGLGGVAGHGYLNLKKGDSGYLKGADCTRRVSAVTAACLMVRKSLYDQVNGLEEQYAVNFNDVDFCMKVLATGAKIIYQPLCECWHYESKSRGKIETKEQVQAFREEINLFLSRWNDFLKKGDGYYNRNLTLALNDYSLGNPFQIELQE